MPLYEYECRSCQARFEHLVFDQAAEVVCRKCGSAEVTRLLSTFAVGSEPARTAPQPGSCAGCPGMQGGTCRMNSD